jgi:hypothetical protein
VLAPVHDADDDGTGIRSDLDQIESGVGRVASSLVQGNDTDLLSFGVDQADRAQPDLLVDTDLVTVD